MLLNHRRETVQQCAEPKTAECPLCGASVIPKVCEKRVSHWAHMPAEHGNICPHVESDWHMKMKLAAMLLGYTIEVPVEVNGVRYLRDAIVPDGSKDLSFIHTLATDYYRHRISALNSLPQPTVSVYDGIAFSSKRGFELTGGRGYWGLLRPKAAFYYVNSLPELGRAFVHLAANKAARCDRAALERTELLANVGPVFHNSIKVWGHKRKARLLLYTSSDAELIKIGQTADAIDPDHPESAPEAIRDRLMKLFCRKLATKI